MVWHDDALPSNFTAHQDGIMYKKIARQWHHLYAGGSGYIRTLERSGLFIGTAEVMYGLFSSSLWQYQIRYVEHQNSPLGMVESSMPPPFTTSREACLAADNFLISHGFRIISEKMLVMK